MSAGTATTRLRQSATAVLVLIAVACSACGGDQSGPSGAPAAPSSTTTTVRPQDHRPSDDATSNEPSETRPAEPAAALTEPTQAEPSEPESATSTTEAATTASDASTASTVTAPAEEDPRQALETDASEDGLAGDAISFGPAAGDRLMVVAVDFDDVLNVRDEPMGTIIAMLDIIRGELEDRLWVLRPDSSVAAYLVDDALVATGRTRSLPRSTWYEVTVGGYTGWVSAAFVAYPATVEDVTEEVIRAAGGVPEAANMDALVRIVLESLEPRIGGESVTVSGPGWFEGLAEVEIDLVVRGSRHFGQRLYLAADAGIDWDDTYEIIDTRLRSATLQTLCTRGWNGERCL